MQIRIKDSVYSQELKFCNLFYSFLITILTIYQPGWVSGLSGRAREVTQVPPVKVLQSKKISFLCLHKVKQIILLARPSCIISGRYNFLQRWVTDFNKHHRKPLTEVQLGSSKLLAPSSEESLSNLFPGEPESLLAIPLASGPLNPCVWPGCAVTLRQAEHPS